MGYIRTNEEWEDKMREDVGYYPQQKQQPTKTMPDKLKITVPVTDQLSIEQFKEALNKPFEDFDGETIQAEVVEIQEGNKEPTRPFKRKVSNELQSSDSISKRITDKTNAIKVVEKRIDEYKKSITKMKKDLRTLHKMAIKLEEL